MWNKVEAWLNSVCFLQRLRFNKRVAQRRVSSLSVSLTHTPTHAHTHSLHVKSSEVGWRLRSLQWSSRFKTCQSLNLFPLMHILIVVPSNHRSLDPAIRCCRGEKIYNALLFSRPCFQTEVLRGRAQCDSKSLPPLCQNEFSQCCCSNPIFVCLTVSFVQTKLVPALPSQRSSLFILIVSGRGNKKEVFLFNIRQ